MNGTEQDIPQTREHQFPGCHAGYRVKNALDSRAPMTQTPHAPYFFNLTTIAPITSPFLKSFLTLFGWLL